MRHYVGFSQIGLHICNVLLSIQISLLTFIKLIVAFGSFTKIAEVNAPLKVGN